MLPQVVCRASHFFVEWLEADSAWKAAKPDLTDSSVLPSFLGGHSSYGCIISSAFASNRHFYQTELLAFMGQTLFRETFEGAFAGCPGDVDEFADDLKALFERLVLPGDKRRFYHWKRSYDLLGTGSAEPGQYLIADTSSPEVSPVFIFFGHQIGSPVPPSRAGWSEMRAFLDLSLPQ